MEAEFSVLALMDRYFCDLPKRLVARVGMCFASARTRATGQGLVEGSAQGTMIEAGMTAKERLLRKVPGWSEHDAEIALRAVEREHAGDTVDEWGDLDAQTDAAASRVMRDLADEERLSDSPAFQRESTR
jgi:hypothetical protein